MKKLLLFFILTIFVSHFSTAQYKVNRLKYDPRTYTPQMGDPYNPTVAGLASFLIPGLGQMVSKEPGRGVAFLAGYIGLYAVAISSVPKIDNYGNTTDGNPEVATLAIIGALGVGIASIVDAVKVAKVNNLAFRDQNGSALKLEIKPYLKTSVQGVKLKPDLGLTLGIKF